MKENKNKKVKIRKSLRYTYIIALLAIIVTSLFVLYQSFNLVDKNNFVKTNIYEYNNKYLYSYDIDMIDNDYIAKENVPDENIYVTELMNKANINMNYVYTANKSENITYSYKIVGNLEATYSKDGDEQKVWKQTDVILLPEEKNILSDKIEINENFEVDLKDKIKKVRDFQENFGIQVQTKYTIQMQVVTRAMIDDQEVMNIYTPDIVFDITSKTTKISSTTEDTAKPQIVTKMVPENDAYSQARAGVATCTFIIAVVLLIVVLVKTTNGNVVRNQYKVELNKILKGCNEKIVEVSSKIDTNGQGVVDVVEFEEIIKISEELFKPILYWNNEEEEESWFCVLGNNMVYRYILKR